MTAATPVMRFLLLCAALALGPAPALAQSTKQPLRIVVPAAAGAPLDALARLVAGKLKGNYTPDASVANLPGAEGREAVVAVKDADIDGTTVLFTPDYLLTVHPHLYRKAGYDPLKDLVPLVLVARSTLVLVGGPSAPATLKQYVDKRASYATPGAGTTSHMAMLLLARASGKPIAPLQRQGAAAALSAAIDGAAAAAIVPFEDLLAHPQGGKLRALAVTGAQRSKLLPQVPTLAESGYKEAVASGWIGFFARAGTPPDAVKRLANGLADGSSFGDVQRFLFQQGMEAAAITPVAFAALVKADLERWGQVVKAAGLKPRD